MNLLVFDSADLDASSLLRVEGHRANHLRDVLGVQPGRKLRVGCLNGPLGFGTVQEVGQREVLIKIDLTNQYSEFPWMDLYLALPRPLMLRRILQAVAALGVRRLVLFRSDRVEKSFFHSPVLEESSIRENLLLGLEQAGTTVMPEVVIYKEWGKFLETELQGNDIGGSPCLIADPEAKQTLSEYWVSREKSINEAVLAIGPEGGWRSHEVESFIDNGFSAVSVGRRVLRVETAVSYIFGQIDALKNIPGNKGSR